MAHKQSETDRIPVTLSLATIAYIENLVAFGVHGSSVPAVMRSLIEQGVRDAIESGLLQPRIVERG